MSKTLTRGERRFPESRKSHEDQPLVPILRNFSKSQEFKLSQNHKKILKDLTMILIKSFKLLQDSFP